MTSAAPKTLRQHSGPPVEFAEDDATVDQFMRPSLALPQKQVKSKKKKTAASNSSNHCSNHYSSNNNKKKNFKSAVGKFLSLRWKRSTTSNRSPKRSSTKSTKSRAPSAVEPKHSVQEPPAPPPAASAPSVAPPPLFQFIARSSGSVAKLARLVQPQADDGKHKQKSRQLQTTQAKETTAWKAEGETKIPVPTVSNVVVEFQRVAETNMTLTQVGAKGLRLAELSAILNSAEHDSTNASATFRVPPGACLTTSAFDAHLAVSSVKVVVEKVRRQLEEQESMEASALSSALAELRTIIMSTPLDVGVCAAVDAFAQTTVARERDPSSVRFAVRSSGSMEDLASKSFAGQYDSILNVSVHVLEHAIKKCWASQYKDHVIPYLQDAIATSKDDASSSSIVGLDLISCAKMGVVLQLMAKPVASGVMFTLDPSAVEKSERMVVEAVHGLGEGKQFTPHFVYFELIGFLQ
jgi:hypothetical protein